MKVEPIDLTIPEPKKETSQADPASLEKGKALLQRVQQALGGADKLAAVKDLQYQANVEIQTPGAVMKVKQTNTFLTPSSMRQDMELPFGKQSVYSDGSAGWMAGMQGMQALPPAVVKQVRGELFRQIALLAMSDRDANRTVNYTGEGTLEISSKDGENVRLEVDEKTGMPAKTSYREGGQGTVSQIFADWRDVNGIRLPFEWTTMQGDKKFATVKIDSYKINSGLTADVLSKKP
jgi:outer membrane lipoprotein-sorting protein